MIPPIAAVVLAAGVSKRMGAANKLLTPADGKPLVTWAVDAALASRADPVVVVTGHQEQAVRNVLRDRPLTFVHNADFAGGLSTSLRAGIGALAGHVAGALVCLADMPRVTAAHMDRLIDAFDAAAIAVPVFDGRRGNPVLLPRRFFAEVMDIEGDVGARGLIARHADNLRPVAMDDGGVLFDMDTAADIRAMSDDTHEAIPYPVGILELADAHTDSGRLADADATATAEHPYCGDRVTVDVKVRDGILTAMAHRVRGCILCEAAATVAARHAVGGTPPALRQTTDALREMLSGDAPPPDAPWNDLAAFLPVRPHKSRHACVLLPFDALLQALSPPSEK